MATADRYATFGAAATRRGTACGHRRGLTRGDLPHLNGADFDEIIVGIMPLEQVVIEVNSDYAERHFSGTGRLVALQDSMLIKLDSHLVSGSFAIPTE